MIKGSRTIQLCRTHNYDMIFLDQRMPELDGTATLAQLTEIFRQKGQNPPVIFLTGQNDKERVIRILNQKPDGYLLKTTSREELLATLKRFFVNAILKPGK